MKGPSAINVELTSRCNKKCFMCGRRKIEEQPNWLGELPEWGDMPLGLVKKIAGQVSPGTLVQLHNNGEPLLYPYIREAINFFEHCITGLNTNAKLLTDMAHEICNLNSLTISIIPNDPEGEDQLLKVQSWLEMDIKRPPIVVFRILGEIDQDRLEAYQLLSEEHNVLIAYRQLHSPDGSFGYQHAPTIPEIGICLEALNKLSIDRLGMVSPCVRFDPHGEHVIGNATLRTLDDIWNSGRRRFFLHYHLMGCRRLASPVCARCDFWGIPRG